MCCVPDIKIIWINPCLTTRKIKILKKWKMHGEIIIFHICTINDNYIMYASWDVEHDRQNFFGILDRFFALLPSKQLKKSKFWKNEKMHGDIIISHMCTINGNHMMYGFWGIKQDGQNFLTFWTSFCPFTPLKTPKINILKKLKKSLEILSF